MQLDVSIFHKIIFASLAQVSYQACSGELTLTKNAAFQYMVYIIIMDSITWCKFFNI